ncbi:MAG: hypothetical protein OEV48_18790 [Acidobacteriota bacterium]|jgi:hypothetical protein|nr:hypothetical protein [Acidobacteriota bacterium]
MKTTKSTLIITVLAMIGVAATLVSCSSTTPTDTPGVERLGQSVLRQYGPELWTVLGYRFANSQIGDEWMILEVGLSSPNGQTATVKREDVFLRTPDGNRVPLPTQKAFNEAYGSLRPVISKANVDRDPLDYFPPSRIECAIQFFVTPGAGVSFDEVTVSDRRGCFGRLYVAVPGGIQQGRWVLGIDQPESEIRIPFDLGE